MLEPGRFMLTLFGLMCTQLFFGHDVQQDLAQVGAWTAHNSGELSLVVGGDPSLYSRGEAHRVFVDGRVHLVRVADSIES